VANGVGLRGPGRYGGVTVEGSRRNVQRMADQARDLQPIVPGRRPGRLANGSRRDAAPRPRVRPAEPGGWALVDSLESLCADLRPRRPTAPRPPSWTTTTSK
jgi:hypothetical protein